MHEAFDEAFYSNYLPGTRATAFPARMKSIRNSDLALILKVRKFGHGGEATASLTGITSCLFATIF